MVAPQPSIRRMLRVNGLCSDSREEPHYRFLPLVEPNERNERIQGGPTARGGLVRERNARLVNFVAAVHCRLEKDIFGWEVVRQTGKAHAAFAGYGTHGKSPETLDGEQLRGDSEDLLASDGTVCPFRSSACSAWRRGVGGGLHDVSWIVGEGDGRSGVGRHPHGFGLKMGARTGLPGGCTGIRRGACNL